MLIGAILPVGHRTVTACLRVMGWGQERRFVNDHRVLHRARWSALTASRLLLYVLVTTFAPHGALVFGLDDTSERRRGEPIKAKGISRDPVRSSHAHVVKVRGLRWLCCMVLVHVPWAETIWGLPVLTVLCSSERSHTAQGRQHQILIDKAWHVIPVVRRWLSTRTLVFVTESRCAVLDRLGAVSQTASSPSRWK
ncbi:MAG: transposase [Candidatus Tectimicrobiota bacterium]